MNEASNGFKMDRIPVEHLVVDASGFIHDSQDLLRAAKKIYTTRDIIDEIKDANTRIKIDIMIHNMDYIDYDVDELKFVVEFAKKTGDYAQLSTTDLKLISCCYQLEKKFNGLKYINQEPKPVEVRIIEKNNSGKHNEEVMKIFREVREDLEDMTIDMPDEEMDLDSSYDDEQCSDDSCPLNPLEGWITPQNLQSIKQRVRKQMVDSVSTEKDLNGRITVACMTSDYSIQNCLLQMGILVVSPDDNLMIKQAKKVAVRCHACFKVIFDLKTIKNKFCPKCGNIDTLKRVGYYVDHEGTKHITINYKRPIRVKGNNKQLPAPRGGKHADIHIMAPDQVIRKDKYSKAYNQEKKNLTQNFVLNAPEYTLRDNCFARRPDRKQR